MQTPPPILLVKADFLPEGENPGIFSPFPTFRSSPFHPLYVVVGLESDINYTWFSDPRSQHFRTTQESAPCWSPAQLQQVSMFVSGTLGSVFNNPGGSDSILVRQAGGNPQPSSAQFSSFLGNSGHPDGTSPVRVNHCSPRKLFPRPEPSNQMKVFPFTKPKFASLKFLGIMLRMASGVRVFLIFFINFSNASNIQITCPGQHQRRE